MRGQQFDILYMLYMRIAALCYLYNNKCFVVCRCAALGWIWACDGSLEPSCYKNDHVMGTFRFPRVYILYVFNMSSQLCKDSRFNSKKIVCNKNTIYSKNCQFYNIEQLCPDALMP